ncbi:hypothetical protein B0H16DRAFT_1396489 [Mycena metata]|uniref:BTB domain-containing protein n=1 Tax=Mycena metata TaxID=1033252 RepID=A0AAD7DSN3_9AGAR|nr:hypothetical protein B0H16DRAFT_1396489 [Mycena metata]
MDVPLAKRRRIDESDATQAPVTRSAEYWFDDGNIILQIESTQFRVAKSVLSMHSSVFRDMFSLPPFPADPDEPTVEGCPVVVLPGDTARDWVFLLGAIYPPGFSVEVPRLEVIAGILRLSKKYDLPIFRKDCLHRLETEFPSTLEGFDNMDNWKCVSAEENVYVFLISLAREIGLYSMLPLLYCIAMTVETDIYMPKILNPNDTDFTASDRLACLMGYTNLLKLQASTTMVWLNLNEHHIPSPACRQSSACVTAVEELILEMSDIRPPELWIIDDWIRDWDKSGMCKPCLKKAKELYEAGRKTCWAQLPEAFGLPDWKELKSMDFE